MNTNIDYYKLILVTCFDMLRIIHFAVRWFIVSHPTGYLNGPKHFYSAMVGMFTKYTGIIARFADQTQFSHSYSVEFTYKDPTSSYPWRLMAYDHVFYHSVFYHSVFRCPSKIGYFYRPATLIDAWYKFALEYTWANSKIND